MIALAQRHLEMLGQPQQHLAARGRSRGLDETQVPGGDFGSDGELQLTVATSEPPFPQLLADAGRCGHALDVRTLSPGLAITRQVMNVNPEVYPKTDLRVDDAAERG
jgi:hypothetical protein